MYKLAPPRDRFIYYITLLISVTRGAIVLHVCLEYYMFHTLQRYTKIMVGNLIAMIIWESTELGGEQ